jgi:riboflavin biosynthesis pyrimidine reductase
MKSQVTRLYPPPVEQVPLEGLYLQDNPLIAETAALPCVYTNFITSLDGRIAIEHPDTGKTKVPSSITNPHDWRLYQELAAKSDVLITTARYLRELAAGSAQDGLPISNDPTFQDLFVWRKTRGMAAQPAVVILSASLDLPLVTLCESLKRPVYIATGKNADERSVEKIEHTGARILYTGSGKKADGKKLIAALSEEGYRNIYSVAGPGALETLLEARVLDRLYLTQTHRLIGGAAYDTLIEDELLKPPVDFDLQALYYDTSDNSGFGQFFAVYATKTTKAKRN